MNAERGKWGTGRAGRTGCVIWAVVLAGLAVWAVLIGLGWLLLKAGI